MNTTTATRTPVNDFAAAVRAALDDLPPEDVEELTDGLEADLTEQAGDPDAGPLDSRDAVAYADELRAAAGLPVRNRHKASTPRLGRRLSLRARTRSAALAAAIRSTAFGSAALDFLVSLRPFWWILRGWAVYQVIKAILFRDFALDVIPTTGTRGLFLLGLVVVSVQWGRGRWLPWQRLRTFATVVSICAIIALPFLLASVAFSATRSAPQPNSEMPRGLSLGGRQISNIFADDAAGRPLTDVQLFDQNGAPLTTVSDALSAQWTAAYGTTGTESILVPNSQVPGRIGWNVFPLKQIDATNGVPWAADGQPDLSTATPAVPPFASVQPLASADAASSRASAPPTPLPSPPGGAATTGATPSPGGGTAQ